ncbi:18766_t:CDS:2 [Funneliformis geosporum]|nr:18766_t:CDS:2 [Funneliformis geosporum]
MRIKFITPNTVAQRKEPDPITGSNRRIPCLELSIPNRNSRFRNNCQIWIMHNTAYFHPFLKVHVWFNNRAKDFFDVSWDTKLSHLWDTASGLSGIHKKSIIHRDFHSGNILINNGWISIGDLGLSKSATEADDNEIYGIIPYMAPEVLQGQTYTEKSDIYSFGMIMWECMTGRRPFWDRAHDTELIIDICDGLRPPIGDIVAPEGYIELMKECWDSDPK